jgi:sialic acid synthase SpsE
MNVPCYKIASYEATDFVLLRKAARTGKPVILSVGYASPVEIEFALATLRGNGAKDIAVLHCVTAYAETPTLEDMNLRTIADIERRFGVVAGFSDNNGGIEAPLFAARAGASIIEKHLTLSRAEGGPDARFSLEPQELKRLVQSVRSGEKGSAEHFKKALGHVRYGPVNATEEYNKRWRRSLFAGADIKKGELFTKENVRDVRPAFGLETKYYDTVVGTRAAKDIPFAAPLSWEMIK